jgi:hypothetical protein
MHRRHSKMEMNDIGRFDLLIAIVPVYFTLLF